MNSKNNAMGCTILFLIGLGLSVALLCIHTPAIAQPAKPMPRLT